MLTFTLEMGIYAHSFQIQHGTEEGWCFSLIKSVHFSVHADNYSKCHLQTFQRK